MATPFLAEIKIMSFGFPPRGWALCNGQLLPINQNQALFALLGTTYGGDGRVTFALPNLQGRAPMHEGNNHILGEQGGEQTHTLTVNEIPTHNHVLKASSTAGDGSAPDNKHVLANTPKRTYRLPDALVSLNPASVSAAGGDQPHQNMQPFLTLNFCIALQGIFPSIN